jgi:predicted aspartyl protease
MFLRLAAIFIVVTGFSVAPLRAATPIASVPYSIDYNGWLTVDVAVNDQGPFRFVVDTGSMLTIAFQNLDEQLHFPALGDQTRDVIGLGSRAVYPARQIDKVAIGDAKLEDLRSVVLDDWNVREERQNGEIISRSPQGVLGLDFLSQFNVVFDRQNAVMFLFERGASPSIVQDWKPTSLKVRRFGKDFELYTVRARINQLYVDMLLDLGASGTLVNNRALGFIRPTTVKTLRFGNEPVVGEVTDALEITHRAKAARVNRVSIGPTTWRDRYVVVFDAPIFETLGVGKAPFGVLGSDLLQDRSFAIDFERLELRIGDRYNNQI